MDLLFEDINSDLYKRPQWPGAEGIRSLIAVNMYYFDEQTRSYAIFFVAVIGLVIYAMMAFFLLVSVIGGILPKHFAENKFLSRLFPRRFYLHKKSDPIVLADSLPGVSVIKPLMGVDPLLEENLESHFKMNYPKFELLFCVQDDQDDAINLVNRMQEKYPGVDTRLFIGGKEGIINPMVHNMAPAYDNVKYEYVWISTSRIKASTDIIMDMACKLQKPNVALCHQMPFTTDQKGFAASIEKIYFGCAAARYYLAFNILGLCCCTGMSYMFKKEKLDEVKGLNWYGRYLAEDFFLTTALHEKGHKLVLSAFPAQQNVPSSSVRSYKDRMVRWLRLRLNMMPIVSGICEPLSDVFPVGIYASWSLYHFFGINPYYFFSAHVLSILLLDYITLKNVQNGSPPFSKLEYIAAWIVREFLTTIVYFEAIFRPRTIHWGSRVYKVSFGGLTTLVKDKS